MAKSSPSLRDVAQAAGVSLGTASRALNNKSNVLPNTRAVVLKAAADLGYKLQIRVPTTIASKLNTIGAVIKRDLREPPQLDPFYYEVLCGIEDECQQLGINLMYASLIVNEYSEATSWSLPFESGDVDGLILVGVVFNDPAVSHCVPQNIPLVIVDAFAKGLECDTIITHNLRGAYDAVTYLIEQGHTHIGLIGTSTDDLQHPGISERRQGYFKALADHGLEANNYAENSLFFRDNAYEATLHLLERAPEISAIFACSDYMAEAVLRAIKALGKRIPEDISVIGFDDTVVARNAQPPLTTMRVDKEFMGALAVRQLYDQAVNRDRPAITSLLATQLVVRESVATRRVDKIED